MPTESILLPTQLCSDCGQWSAVFGLLCHRHNQNSLRPVSSLSPKLYFSPTFGAPQLLSPPLTEWKERDRKTERVRGWRYPVQDADLLWKASFLSVHTQIHLKTCSCVKQNSPHYCVFTSFSKSLPSKHQWANNKKMVKEKAQITHFAPLFIAFDQIQQFCKLFALPLSVLIWNQPCLLEIVFIYCTSIWFATENRFIRETCTHWLDYVQR